MAERTEDLGLAGVLTLTMGGRRFDLPVLKIVHSREWKARLGSIASGIEVDASDLAAMVTRLANLPTDIALDLVVAYDRTDVLGGRDAIEAMATDAEVIEAAERMVVVTFPKAEAVLRQAVEAFGPQMRTLGLAFMESLAGRLKQAISTPTPSASGDSTPTSLSADTPTSSSTSSGPTTSDDGSTTPGTSET